jgi:hypothetical protein
MKSVFGFDVTEDKRSEKTYSELFLTKKPSEGTSSELDERVESFETTTSNAKLHPILGLLKWVGLFLVLIVLRGLLEVGFEQAMRNAPLLMIAGILGGIVSAVLFIIGKIKKDRVYNEEDVGTQLDMLEVSAKRVFAELEVPESSIPTDILLFRFVVKDGECKAKEFGLSVTPYFNHEMRAYLKDYNLCLADVGGVYSFPLESLRRITTVKKRIILPEWNKEENYNKGIYKQYKIGSNQYGVSVKPYYILELEKDGEEYGIYFPSYELPTFESLTLLHAENPDDMADEDK